MDRGGTLGEAEVAAKVCTPMLISLAKCHALNIIHRDIKPENIFIDREDRVRRVGAVYWILKAFTFQDFE